MENENKVAILNNYIDLIDKGLKDPKSNKIALQQVVDNFITCLSPAFQDEWYAICKTVSGPQYLSNQTYLEKFTSFLYRVKNALALKKTDEGIINTISPEKLRQLVIEKETYLKQVSEAETSWKEKTLTRWREKIELSRKRVYGLLTQEEEKQLEQLTTSEGKRLKDLAPEEKEVVVDYVVSTAQAVSQQPAEKPVDVKKAAEDILSSSERYQRLILGLSPNSSQSLFNMMAMLLADENIKKDLANSATHETYTNISAVTDVNTRYLFERDNVPTQKKDQAILTLTDYHLDLNRLLTTYGADRFSLSSLSSLISSNPRLKFELDQLGKKYFSLLSDPKFGLKSSTIAELFTHSAFKFSAIKDLKEMGWNNFLQSRIGQIRLPHIYLPSFGAPSFSFGTSGFQGAFSGLGNAASSLGNNLLSGAFGLGNKLKGLSTAGKAAKTAAGVLNPAKKIQWIMIGIGIFSFIFLTGFTGPTTNTIYMTESAAFPVYDQKPEEFAITPSDFPLPDSSISPYVGPLGPVDVPGCPLSGGVRYNNPPYKKPTHEAVNAYDLWPAPGSTVYSPVNGFIVSFRATYGKDQYACCSYDNPNCDLHNYGNYIIIKRTENDEPNGKTKDFFWFGHLLKVTSLVATSSANTLIKVGDAIGLTDNNGCSDGSHLHYEHRGSGGNPDNAPFFDPIKCKYIK